MTRRRAARRCPDGGVGDVREPYRRTRARLWMARLDLPEPVLAYLHRYGTPIAYPYVTRSWPLEMYQTVYASQPGLGRDAVGRARVQRRASSTTARARDRHRAASSLHTGVSSLEKDEPPYEEWYEVPADDGGGGKRREGARRPGDRRRHDGRARARELGGRRAVS